MIDIVQASFVKAIIFSIAAGFRHGDLRLYYFIIIHLGQANATVYFAFRQELNGKILRYCIFFLTNRCRCGIFRSTGTVNKLYGGKNTWIKILELTDKLMRLQWLMHKKRRMMRMAEGPMGDTTRGQGRLLALLKIKDGISTRDLSYLLGARVSSMNELLAKMEKSGYIMREASEDDKRVMLIRLTEKGRDQQVPRHAAIGGLFNCLSAEEQDVLGGYLDRITDALEEEIGPGDEDGRAADWMRAQRNAWATNSSSLSCAACARADSSTGAMISAPTATARPG
jgi:DNA-binding MarR family transcriptional regulator